MSNRLAIVMCVLIGFLSSCSVGPTAATPEVEPDDRAIETTASTIPTKTVKPSVTPSPTQTLNPSATPKPSPTLTTTPIIVGPFHQVFLDEPLPHDIASIIHISEDGTVWLGTEKDIVLLKDFTWDVYLQDFPGELIGVDEAKRVWVVDQNGSSISVV
jgi:hypothetical protein